MSEATEVVTISSDSESHNESMVDMFDLTYSPSTNYGPSTSNSHQLLTDNEFSATSSNLEEDNLSSVDQTLVFVPLSSSEDSRSSSPILNQPNMPELNSLSNSESVSSRQFNHSPNSNRSAVTPISSNATTLENSLATANEQLNINEDRTVLNLTQGINSFNYNQQTSPVLATRNRQLIGSNLILDGSDSDSDFQVVTRNIRPVNTLAATSSLLLPVTNLSQDKKRKMSSPEQRSSKKQAVEEEKNDEEEGMTCPICFEFWTNDGDHRLVSLKCGHLFGKKCVERWIKDCQQKCPQCNSKARKADIRVIYAKNLKALDTTEWEHALREAKKIKSQNQDKDIEIANIQMQYQITLNECTRLKSEVYTLRANQNASRHFQTTNTQNSSTENLPQSSTSEVCYEKCVSANVSQTGGCRFMDYDKLSGNFAISQPSPFENSIMRGFGVKKLSIDLRSKYFTPLHQKAIKDLKFSPLLRDRLLSASQDGSLRITDLFNNSKVHEYKVGKPVWSCCWDSTDVNIIYAGLNNGSFVQYDLRNTSDLLSTISTSTLTCPVVSLYHIPPTATQFFQGRGGLLCATLDGASLWQDVTENGPPLIENFKPTLFPLQQNNCTGVKYCHETQSCLFSFRPGRSYPTTTHHLCQLTCKNSGGNYPQVGCEFINTYIGGKLHKMLTRNALFVLPDKYKNKQNDKLLACVGNESRQNVQIYNASNGEGKLLQQFPTEGGTCLDITPVHAQSDDLPMLATLTQTSLQLYKIK